MNYNNPSHTEQEWIERLQHGDQAAYEWLFDQYYDLLCRMACVWLNGDRYAAQTVVSDVVFRIWNQRQEWRVERSLRNYLIRAVRNGCLNVLSSVSHTRRVSLSGEQVPAESTFRSEFPTTPYGVLIEHELEDCVAAAIDGLPEKTREVFVKCRIEQLSYAQAAEQLGISVHTVKYHLTSAVQLLHKQLKHHLIFLLAVSIETATVFL